MKIGIFGATGIVGKEIMSVLADRSFPVTNLRVYAGRSAGNKIQTPFGTKLVENANQANYSELDLAFFAIGSNWAKENAQKATEQGCYVIDNSSTFRYDPQVPLIIPEINPGAIKDSRLIANPNCTTAIAAIPLHKLKEMVGLERVIVSTYQAASGAGKEAMEELETQTRQYVDGEELQVENFQYQLLFNAIPHIDDFQDNGYTKEEMKVFWELNKIFGIPQGQEIPISCTSVRIPAIRAHSESISAQTISKSKPDEFRDILRHTQGVEVVDDPTHNQYPMQLTASNKYDVQVGRIRQSIAFGNHGLDFYVCGDQLLKGAALNAVQIGELIAGK